jgi:uncharacterized membrane protein (UPF0182 family)
MSNSSASKSKRRLSPAVIATLIVVGVGILLLSSAGVYTDFLWYKQLGYQTVFTTNLIAESWVFGVSALTLALVTGLSLGFAYRNRPIYGRIADQANPFEQYRLLLTQLRRLIMIGLPAVVGVFGGIAVSQNWQVILQYLNRTSAGVKDPQFGLDVSFYLFELPFYQGLVTFLSATLLLALLGAVLVMVVTGSIKFTGRSVSLAKAARVQLAITAALFLAVQAASLWLDQFHTMTNSAGLYTGATYSDVNGTIPGFQIMAGIGLLVAILFLVAAVTSKWRLPLMATALMVVSSLVLGSLYPWIVQTFQVVPNERTLEGKYIERNIAATRAAYGIADVEKIDYKAKTTATAGALRADAETTAQIRIIDPALVSASFRQLEQFRQYYNFENHLDVDRYNIAGKSQDTVLGVRELNQSGLGDSQSWYNNTIVYTHGYGLVAAYGNQRSSDGQPVFLQSGIPSTGALGKFEPRIYFGEQSPTYSIVGAPKGTADRELDYPAGTGDKDQTYTTFTGNGGPKLNNIISRLAYALKFQSEQLLLSDAITNDSQILYNRSPRERVQAVAPYLTLDSDIYPAVVDGHVVWIVDGYTTSANYPYSRAENLSQNIADSSSSTVSSRQTINYVRNSVKATVDAYDGSVKLYAWDDKDPILKTWSKIYANTVLPVSEMSGALMSHVRYPADLFKLQRSILGMYHVTDAGSFYSQQDAWMTPNDPVQGTATSALQPPYYLTMQAPGQDKPAFSIYSTFIPRSTGEQTRNVLTGYLVADSDAGSTAGQKSAKYGQLRLLTLPRETVVPGPGQVQNNFNADSDVSKLLNLLRQGSTTVLNGNLLTIPVGGGLLYVQPVYIKSTGETSFPLLKKVLVAFGDQIAFEDTLTAALDSLFGGSSGVTEPTTPTDPGTSNGGSSSGSTNTALKAALEKARLAVLAKNKALANSDWAAYGKADKALTDAINAALAAANK